ncbi:flagellar hook protein FlgE [Phreatobacter aquaticus]|uniref:Flagellar hook protein FlgE n=1 Tax=Phreatobacter aquaticus TaxID=2570229 RepID=A0A4D7QJP5_9HYPH|nr:flagellar hook protein FlgE [Phreatobacter aquaticus]QCK85584.1 flagellar hook protein FlgE [Phreatobacter aquaticus]
MSLSGALNSAVSALSSQSSALAMISDNISNSSTYGYKTTTASFESMLTGSSSSAYSSGGVSVSSVSNISTAGLLVASTTSSNMAISGSGFFVVTDGANSNQTFYSRNGEFTTDSDGYLVNGDYYLQGWKTDAEGNIVGSSTQSSLTAIDTNSVATIASATTKMSLQANLPSNAATNDTFTSEVELYDSLGTAATSTVTWTKTGDNAWTASFSDPTAADGTTQLGTVSSSDITITFNTDGTLASTSPSPATLSIGAWTTGAADSTITLDMGTIGSSSGLTQLSSTADTLAVSLTQDQDGVSYGSLTGVEIGDNGTVYANYDNGEQRAIYKVAVATFNNADGLTAMSGGVYAASSESGGSTLHIAGTGGAGDVLGSKLEASTTDTNQEFSNMMSAQQAYSAAAQVMSTVNKMYDTLISAVR